MSGQQPGPNAQNPQAYDELKKRLLNEYKKLVNNKKSAPGTSSANQSMALEVPDGRDHGRNLAGINHKSVGGSTNTGGKSGMKKHSSRMAASSQNNSSSNAGATNDAHLAGINAISQ